MANASAAGASSPWGICHPRWAEVGGSPRDPCDVTMKHLWLPVTSLLFSSPRHCPGALCSGLLWACTHGVHARTGPWAWAWVTTKEQATAGNTLQHCFNSTGNPEERISWSVWWVDFGWLPGAHQAALSLPHVVGRKCSKGLWAKLRTGR